MEVIGGLDPAVSLLGVAGRPAVWHGLSFVSTLLWADEGWEDEVALPLCEFTSTYLPVGVAADGENPLEDGDALWVRARLPMVFRFAPPTFRRTWRLGFLNTAFLALTPQSGGKSYDALPFFCVDVNLRAELRFSRAVGKGERRRVGEAFWNLLASEPEALASYRDRVWLEDAGLFYGVTVGYWRGQFHVSGGYEGWE